MKIGIVGQGFVGTAVREGFKNYFDVETFDIIKDSSCNSLSELSNLSDVIFVCLPTPMEATGECHLDIVENTLLGLDLAEECKTIVVKSTIPPGTTEKWNKKFNYIQVVFNPEFLTEANSIEDYKNQNRIIIGGPRPATTKVKRIFAKAFPKVPIIKTGPTTAEMVKYFANCFLATKVSFANEMKMFCDTLKIDYDKVVEYATYDERLGKSHWAVPGPDGDLGFGGHCLPKDLSAIISLSGKLGGHTVVLEAVRNLNLWIRKHKDWEEMKGRAVV